MATQATTDDDFCKLVQDVDRLMLVDDPEDHPYQSKYEARRIINAWQSSSPSSSDAESTLLLEQARTSFRLGKIGLDTEEPHEAEIHLSKAVDIFFPGLLTSIQEQTGAAMLEDEEASGKAVDVTNLKVPPITMSAALAEVVQKPEGSGIGEEAMETLNLLGILWTGRQQLRRALLFLLTAKEIYNTLDPCIPSDKKKKMPEASQQQQQQPQASTSPLPDSESSSCQQAADGTFRRKLDGHFTHTLFYLAQVYGAFQDADTSASYCEQTLERQLEWEVDLDALGWISNCMSLVDYFVNREGDLHSAAKCLQACETLLKDRVPASADPEKVKFTRGDLARRWTAIYLYILNTASEFKDHARFPGIVNKPPVLPQPRIEVQFPILGLAPVTLPDPSEISTYDKARAVFLKATKHLDEAKAIFVLDGYVTDHVNLLREGSRLYRYLSSFEADDKRRQAMYLRRAGMLQPLIDELNPKAYEALHKMLAFELGEIYLELVDMKIHRIEDKVQEDENYHIKKSEMDKCNEYCQHAIKSFEHFVDMYKKMDDTDPTKKVWNFEKDDLRPILRAYFHLARLYGRYDLFGSIHERIEATKKSLAEYENLNNFGKREIKRLYHDDPHFFAEEMLVVKDMIEMLPSKISKMHYQGQQFTR